MYGEMESTSNSAWSCGVVDGDFVGLCMGDVYI